MRKEGRDGKSYEQNERQACSLLHITLGPLMHHTYLCLLFLRLLLLTLPLYDSITMRRTIHRRNKPEAEEEEEGKEKGRRGGMKGRGGGLRKCLHTTRRGRLKHLRSIVRLVLRKGAPPRQGRKEGEREGGRKRCDGKGREERWQGCRR